MTRDNLLFAIIGVLFGFIVGFMFASNMSQRMTSPGMAGGTQNLPSDHPPIQSGNAQDPQQVFAQVQQSMARARNEPRTLKRRSKPPGSSTRSSDTIRPSSFC